LYRFHLNFCSEKIMLSSRSSRQIHALRRADPTASQSSRRSPGKTSIALIAILLAAGITADAGAFWPFDELFHQPSLRERSTALLSEAIQIQTVNPPGNEQTLARILAAELARAGISNKVIPTPGPSNGPARAAVWGRLPGSGDRPALVLLSHLDTVPAVASEWSMDPFSGAISEGFVWGRGALDAKGATIAHLMTLIELSRSNTTLDRDIIFLATPDEETGGRLGAGWIAANRPDLLAGAGYLLTEGGGIRPGSGTANTPTGTPSLWGVSLTEKAPCWLELRSHGRAGHSSTPTPDAAVPRLIAALDRIRRAESPVRVIDEVDQMFAALANFAPEWDRAGFADLGWALKHDEAFRRRFLDNPSQNALVRNTVSITVLEGAPKTNIAPGLARAQLDARLLPGESCEEFAASIADLIDESAIEIENILSFPARASSADSALYRAIAQVAGAQEIPGLVVPRMIGGFTDAHWFRDLGIVSYGFIPRAVAPENARRVHGIDERIRIETLIQSIELTLEIVRTFDALESREHQGIGASLESGETREKAH
jgi:acetylornithine deacetylase/succinyl-diaminopimelate desuccinylase-like protein